MIIKTIRSARRLIVFVFGITFTVVGGILLYILQPEMPKGEKITLWVSGPVLIISGLVLTLAGALGVKHTKRYLKIGSGLLLLVVGLLTSVPGIPGPGFLTIIGGLALLAGEYVWARKLLDRCKNYGEQLKNAVQRKPTNGVNKPGNGTESKTTG